MARSQRHGVARLRDAGRPECGRGGVRCRHPGDAGASRRGDRPGARRPATLISECEPFRGTGFRPGGRRGLLGTRVRARLAVGAIGAGCAVGAVRAVGALGAAGTQALGVLAGACASGAARGGEGFVVVPAHDQVGPGGLVPEVGAGLGALGRGLATGVGAGLVGAVVASVGQALRREPAWRRSASRPPSGRPIPGAPVPGAISCLPADLRLTAGLRLTACLRRQLGLALQLLGLPGDGPCAGCSRGPSTGPATAERSPRHQRSAGRGAGHWR